jgi:signal transduction histidine kinase
MKIRHGAAKRVSLEIQCFSEQQTLVIVDDGCGMPSRLIDSDGMGLKIMSHRARMIGGEVISERAESGGTKLMVRWPKGRVATAASARDY